MLFIAFRWPWFVMFCIVLSFMGRRFVSVKDLYQYRMVSHTRLCYMVWIKRTVLTLAVFSPPLWVQVTVVCYAHFPYRHHFVFNQFAIRFSDIIVRCMRRMCYIGSLLTNILISWWMCVVVINNLTSVGVTYYVKGDLLVKDCLVLGSSYHWMSIDLVFICNGIVSSTRRLKLFRGDEYVDLENPRKLARTAGIIFIAQSDLDMFIRGWCRLCRMARKGRKIPPRRVTNCSVVGMTPSIILC